MIASDRASINCSERWRIRDMLEKAGFRVRGESRADCAHCEGRSRATVSFTAEVAFCHRCKWRANTLTLARELGLLKEDTGVVSAFREEARRRRHLEAEIERFEAWRGAMIREVSDRYRALSKAAITAEKMLRESPECPKAWHQLAQFHGAVAQLSAAFDWLMFTKASVWLEVDSTPVEVFEAWRGRAA
jgi:hypothetical protein